MTAWLSEFSSVTQAFIATLFTWALTALGAATVFFFKRINKNVLDGMLGFAAGIMIAASFWSLLAPAIELAEAMGYVDWLVVAAGFLSGGVFLWIVDRVLPHIHPGLGDCNEDEVEGIHTTWKRSVLLVMAITLHNIPEGLAVGVAFGAVASGFESASLPSAIVLAIGIGIQNFPEGAAVSIPLRREGLSRTRAFMYGQASGVVEPIAGVLGAWAVLTMRPILPFALAFAAGAMIYVVVEEIIPEAQNNRISDIGTIGAMVGFAVMMVLDVSLG